MSTLPTIPNQIITPKDLSNATSVLSHLNRTLDQITEEKEKVTKPLNEALKAERQRFKPLEEQLTAAITTIKSLMSDYLRKEQDLKDKALQALADGKLSLSKAVALAGQETTGSQASSGEGKVSFITVTKFHITDITKVPHDYLLPNEPAIRQAIKDNTIIPGIEIYQDKQIRNTR